MTNGRERRVENRVSVSWKAKVRVNAAGLIGPALVQNVSLSGVYLLSRLKLDIHDEIALESFLEYSSKSHTLLVKCEVMRCVLNIKEGVHGYGARFIVLGKANLSFLLPLIADLWIQQRDQFKSEAS